MIHGYKHVDGDVDRRISDLLALQQRECTNPTCSKTYDNCKRKCDDCGFPVRKVDNQEREKTTQTSSSNGKKIFWVEVSDNKLKKMQIGEPILLNPTSYRNIETILKELKINLDISNSRQWSFIGCDGPPYCIASRICEANPELYTTGYLYFLDLDI